LLAGLACPPWTPAAPAASKRLHANAIELPTAAQRQVHYFGDIHPILAEHCFSCHGPQKQKGGLRLDSRERALLGGDTYGPALVPGKSAESPLLLFMAHLEADMEMPPGKEERISQTHLSLIRAWIDQGAVWPVHGSARASETPTLGNQQLLFQKAAKHWAFQPVAIAEAGGLDDGPATIDRLVDARRKTHGLSASRRADAFTLLKRLHFDLAGLPPSPEEMETFSRAFSNDPTAALAAKVDELLESPNFGERWGRYWLDIARYADSQDLFPGQDLRYPFAWTYRDYVIESFNSDKPYDQFIREQVAADLLGLPQNDPTLAALGFLTVGPRFLRKEAEQINDRIDVVTRGVMGLTVACARCHNHKFDPIPTTDFYALYGVFQSSKIPDPLPTITLPGAQVDPKSLSDYEEARAKTRGAIEELNASERTKAIQNALDHPEDYFNALCDVEYGRKPLNAVLNTTPLSSVVLTALGAQKRAFKKNTNNRRDPIMGPLAVILSEPPERHSELLLGMLDSGRMPVLHTDIHPMVLKELRAKKIASEEELVRAYGTLLAKAKTQTDGASAREIRDGFTQKNGLLDFPLGEVEKAAATTVSARKEYGRLYSELAEIENTHPGAPVRAMALKDHEKPVQPVVFVRGDPANRGDAVDRRFLEILDPQKTAFSSTQSGRRELAEHLTRPSNPLTPRVWANQVWRHLLGRSLVKTTSDLGLQADPPTHPELLDWLASALVQRGWSTKRLVRDIVLSATYQQTSLERPEAAATDPDNTWLWRAHRRRLDVEAMRDAMLAVSGNLDSTRGGRAISLTAPPFSGRRTVYGFIDRVQMNPMFATFDFPPPDTANTERTQTTVPQQALFALNDTFTIAQARSLALKVRESVTTTEASSASQLTHSLYRRIFQRTPLRREEDLAGHLLSDSGPDSPHAPAGSWQYGFGDADPGVPRSSAFQSLSYFDQKTRRYQSSPAFPDRAHGFVSLSEFGGHPGEGVRMAAIRRWIAPHDGEFAITGEILLNPKGSGDGIRARVISQHSGPLGEWILDRPGNPTCSTLLPSIHLKAGEILDFTVDSRENSAGDGFRWSPCVRSVGTPGIPSAAHPAVWDAKTDFSAPPPPKLTPLERMAQALLMTNEFMFVD
jgi:hypothetical protein